MSRTAWSRTFCSSASWKNAVAYRFATTHSLICVLQPYFCVSSAIYEFTSERLRSSSRLTAMSFDAAMTAMVAASVRSSRMACSLWLLMAFWADSTMRSASRRAVSPISIARFWAVSRELWMMSWASLSALAMMSFWLLMASSRVWRAFSASAMDLRTSSSRSLNILIIGFQANFQTTNKAIRKVTTCTPRILGFTSIISHLSCAETLHEKLRKRIGEQQDNGEKQDRENAQCFFVHMMNLLFVLIIKVNGVPAPEPLRQYRTWIEW